MKLITFEEAEWLVKRTDYAFCAHEPEGNEINWADAAAFFLEGYNYAIKQNCTNTLTGIPTDTNQHEHAPDCDCPECWADRNTDACGNTISDADPGL